VSLGQLETQFPITAGVCGQRVEIVERLAHNLAAHVECPWQQTDAIMEIENHCVGQLPQLRKTLFGRDALSCRHNRASHEESHCDCHRCEGHYVTTKELSRNVQPLAGFA